MAAGVHDADFVAVLVPRAHFAGVGQAGLFGDRQRVHIGADQHGRPGAVLQNADYSMPAHFSRDDKAERLQLLGHAGGRLLFLKRQLRI